MAARSVLITILNRISWSFDKLLAACRLTVILVRRGACWCLWWLELRRRCRFAALTGGWFVAIWEHVLLAISRLGKILLGIWNFASWNARIVKSKVSGLLSVKRSR